MNSDLSQIKTPCEQNRQTGLNGGYSNLLSPLTFGSVLLGSNL